MVDGNEWQLKEDCKQSTLAPQIRNLYDSTSDSNKLLNNGDSLLISPELLREQLSQSKQPVETISLVQRTSSWGNVCEKVSEKCISQPMAIDEVGKRCNKLFIRNFKDTMRKMNHVERILPLLDVHSQSRTSLFKSIYIRLLCLFNQKLDASPNNSAWDYIFQDFIAEYNNSLIKSIFHNNLPKILPSVTEAQLKKLSSNPSIYANLPLLAKQYIWASDSDLFLKEIIKLLESAIQIDQDYYRSLDLSDPFSKECSLLRKQDEICQQLAQLVFFPKLYNAVVKFLLTSYQNSSRDTIYTLILFSFEYHVRMKVIRYQRKISNPHSKLSSSKKENKEIPESDVQFGFNIQDFISDIEKGIAQRILKIFTSPKSKDKTSGALTSKCLEELYSVLKNIPSDHESDKKLSFVLLSSPLFIHLLSNTLYALLMEALKKQCLIEDSSDLKIVIIIIEFISQDIDLEEDSWLIKIKPEINMDIVTKLLPICMMQLFCAEKHYSHKIPFDKEVNEICKESKCASFIVFQTIIWSLKAVHKAFKIKREQNVTPKSQYSNPKVTLNDLCRFIEYFQQEIINVAPEYWLEFITFNFYIEQIDLKNLGDESKQFIVDQLLIFWLMNAYYPANFIIIKLLNSSKSQLSNLQWQYVCETAMELDHESFNPD